MLYVPANDMAFLTMILSQLKKHDVVSKEVRKHLISKVPSTFVSTRSRLLCQKHQTQWEKYPQNTIFFSGNSMIGIEQTDNIKMKWTLTGVVAVLWKWPSLFQRQKSSTGSWKAQNSLTTQHVNAVSNVSIGNIICHCCVSLSGLQSVPLKYNEYESKNI